MVTALVCRGWSRTSGKNPTYGTHGIADPVSSAGKRVKAMLTHRQMRLTPRVSGIGDPEGGFASPPDSLRHAGDATASPRAPRLAGRTCKAVPWVPYVGFLPLGARAQDMPKHIQGRATRAWANLAKSERTGRGSPAPQPFMSPHPNRRKKSWRSNGSISVRFGIRYPPTCA